MPSRTTTWFTYHEVAPDSPRDAYTVGVDAFRGHLAEIASRDRNVVITFDDGHMSQYEQAFPVLEACGVKAIFFITAGWVGKRSDYMAWRELRELSSAGHVIQSHGWSHAYLTNCSAAKLDHEIRSSRATLEDHLGAAVTDISMPGGRWNRRVAEACRAAGLSTMYTSDPWLGPVERQDLTQIGRFMVRRRMNARDLEAMIASKSRRFDLLRLEHHAKKTLQLVAGDRVYHKLWRWASHRKQFCW